MHALSSERTPALLLAVSAAGFLIWALVLLLSPGGSKSLEWIQLVVSGGALALGIQALRSPTPQRARAIRWILLAFAVFGVVAVIGLAADDNSSRTWARLAWAALITGAVTAAIAWWNAPEVSRTALMTGGVVAAVLVTGGLSITLRCDDVVQRSWCDPRYEQEQALAERIVVSGGLQRTGRAGGAGGAALMAYFIPSGSIVDNTTPPEGFVYEERPIQSIEVERGRYTASSGPYSHCRIDVKVEQIPAGTLETLTVTCRPV